MSWSKRQIIEQAFDELGLGSYAFDMQPEQVDSAMRRLDAMMAGWAPRLSLAFPLHNDADAGDPDEDSYLPDSAVEAVYLALAVRLASSLGKAVSAELKASAKAAYDSLLAQRGPQPAPMQLPSRMPLGAGNRRFGRLRNFAYPPVDPLRANRDNTLDYQ